VLLESVRWAKTEHPYHHLAHVILSDHLHWMLLPEAGTSYSDLVAATKRDVTWRLKEKGLSGPFRQKRFYDHVIRDGDDFGRHLDYVHFNPVKHGCATRAADYRWSSFREWVKRGAYPEDWGAIEPDWIKAIEPE
jgi:putative transposase